MTATNHALTGALIGLNLNKPLFALPIALLSHFICDAIPHYTSDKPTDQVLRSSGFRNYLVVDASLCVLLVVVLAIFQPAYWLLAAVCAFLATSPDLWWINRYRLVRSGRMWRPGVFSRFARDIQWFTKPIGGAVEATWFIGTVILLLPFLH